MSEQVFCHFLAQLFASSLTHFLSDRNETSVASERPPPVGLRSDGFYFQPDIPKDSRNTGGFTVVSQQGSDRSKVFFVVNQPGPPVVEK
jgi:hypothetical protein